MKNVNYDFQNFKNQFLSTCVMSLVMLMSVIMPNKSAFSQCPAYGLSLGNPIYDCNDNMVKLGVFINWNFLLNGNPADVDIYSIDLKIFFQPGNGIFEFKELQTSNSLNKDFPLESREDINFMFNSTTKILSITGNIFPRLTFKGNNSSLRLFDLYFIAFDKTGVDIQESNSTFCVWNYPSNCPPTDCLHPSNNAAIRFIDPNPLDGFNVQGFNNRKPIPQQNNNGLINTKVILEAGTFLQERIADYTGYYCFSLPHDPAPIGANNYSVIVSRDGNMTCGVTAGDISEIRKLILGVIPSWTEPSKFVAADMNNNGTISTADIVCIQKLILGRENSENCQPPSWKFVYEQDYDLFKQNNPSGIISNGITAPFLKTFNYQSSTQFRSFAGVKMGDVNYTCLHYQPGNFQDEDITTRSVGQSYTLFCGPVQNYLGINRIPVYASDNSTFAMLGSSFYISNANVVGVLSGQISNNDYMVTTPMSQNNGINMTWVSEASSGQIVNSSSPIFYIEVSNLQNNGSYNLPTLDVNSPTENLLMKSDGSEYDIVFQYLTSNLLAPKREEKVFVSPNPTSDYIDIMYYVSIPGNIDIQIRDNTNRLMDNFSQNVSSGWNTLHYNTLNQLPGIYFINVVENKESIVKKYFKN